MAAKPEPVEVAPEPAGEVDFAGVREALAAAVSFVLPGWLAAHREDLVQTATMRVVSIMKNASRRSVPAAYLRRVAHSVIVDEIRRQRARPEVAVAELDEPGLDAGPERRAAGRQIGAAIVDCLARLSDDRRRAVTLHLLGHAPAEIAVLLGWSPKRAENLSLRGLADLRACLAKKGVAP
jgi:RNA polymerase sigma factor (sigma-70 family)